MTSWARKGWLASGLLAATACVAPPASAQDASVKTDVALDNTPDIVVTATRRRERLQDVPQAVTALTGASLAERGATSFQDYLTGVPGVSFFQSGGQTNAIFIRGVSSGVNIGADSTTGIYIDEAPVSQAAGATVDLSPFDLERVEVLRGPQGTLFGAGSMGGTVRLILAKPDATRIAMAEDLRVSATEHGGVNVEANAMVNLPLVSDTLALRLVGGYRYKDGFIDDRIHGDHDYNTDTLGSLRAALRWTPDAATDVVLSGNYQEENYFGFPDAVVAAGYGPYDGGTKFVEHGKQPFLLVGLTVNEDLGFATLTSATNYSKKNARVARDYSSFVGFFATPTATDYIGLNFGYNAHDFTQEVRLASKTGGRIAWLIGTYYERGSPPDLIANSVNNIPGLETVNILSQTSTGYRRQIAGFGEIGYKLTPKLTATAGVRYSAYKSASTTVAGGLLGTDSGEDETSNSKASNHFVDQKYELSYALAPDHLLYGRAASGSREGGDSGLSAVPLACRPVGASNQTSPDTLWSYEAGSKNSFAAGALTLNAAGYVTRWKQIQSLTFLDCGQSLSVNLGAATIKGAELEAALKPFAGLTLTASGAYTHTKITEGNAAIGAVVGDPLPLVPEFNASASARYEFALDGAVRMYVRGDATHVSGEYQDFKGNTESQFPLGYRKIPAYTVANARVGLTMGEYEVALYASNLLDDRNVINIKRSPLRTSVLTPRTIGINLSGKF